MHRAFSVLFAALVSVAAPLQAQEGYETLGFGRLFSNDAIGDGKDRWRTGAYAVSWVRGRGWDGELPGAPGDVLEFRLRADLIAPANLVAPVPAPNDRRYVGALSLGVHTHWQADGNVYALGLDAVAMGPQTGLGDLQRIVHDILGMSSPAAALANQIPNSVSPRLSFELGRPLALGGDVTLRPFLAAEAGVETLVRVGGEVMVGPVWNGNLLLRDTATGQLYNALRDAPSGVGFVMGADIAHVWTSDWLPASSGYQLTDARARARAGLRWEHKNVSAFYGLTWLGKEFTTQPESQLLGSLSINISF